MSNSRQLVLSSRYFISITIASYAIVMLLFFFSSCSNRKEKLGEAITERDSLPVMATTDVISYISDSGVIRYKINAKEWLVYDRKVPSYWAFEKGVYLEEFDSLLHVESSIAADTAYYYDKKKLWRLSGNVKVKNHKGENFQTELLYWDQQKEKVYSDQYIRIEQPERVIEGNGFTSNQQMTVYQITDIQGIFYVDEEKTKNDTTTIDSTKN